MNKPPDHAPVKTLAHGQLCPQGRFSPAVCPEEGTESHRAIGWKADNPRADDRTPAQLRDIAIRDETQEWRDWVRRLMPGNPDPRVNLALTLERAGRTNDAIDAYTSAFEVYAEYLPAMQGLARLQVRTGRRDDRTETLLREIALRGETEEWRQWAASEQSRSAR